MNNDNNEILKKCIGDPTDEITKELDRLGWYWIIYKRDGENFLVPQDIRTDRIMIETYHNKIVNIYIG